MDTAVEREKAKTEHHEKLSQQQQETMLALMQQMQQQNQQNLQLMHAYCTTAATEPDNDGING